MSDASQILEGMALLCDRVGFSIVDITDADYRGRLNLHVLAFPLRFNDRACDTNRSASRQFRHGVVVGKVLIRDDLNRVETGTVMHGEKGEPSFGYPYGTEPPFNSRNALDGF